MILDMLRKSQTWFTKGILIVLAITFAFGFGFSFSHFGFGGRVAEGTAAEVNGEEIPLLEFYRVRDRLRIQYRQSGVPEESLNYNFIGITALNQLIDLKLLSQKAKELGFRITDEELGQSIKSDPAFQVDGRFIGAKEYRSFIERGLNETVGDFERRYREELLAQKLIRFIFETAKVTDEELFNIYRIQNEKANLYFVSFSPEDFRGSFSASEQDIKSYYENHKGEFKNPELRSIRYVTLSSSELEKRVSVSQEETKAYYEAYPDKFRSTEKEIRPLSEVKDEIESNIKKQGGEALLREFLGNLRELLDKKSLDEIAKENGLGGVSEASPFSVTSRLPEIPSQVVEKAFSIREGEKAFSQIGGKVYIIQVARVIPSREKTLKEAESEIREGLRFTRAKEAAEAKAEEVLKAVKTSGGGLEEVEKSLELKLEETGYFSRLGDVPKIDSDEVKIDAFLLDDKNPTASKVYRAGDKFYIISLKEKQSIDPKKFEEEKAELRENELSQRRRQLYADWVRKLRQESKIAVNENLFPPQG